MIVHAADCAEPRRLESYTTERPDGRPVTITRCQECAAQVVVGPAEEPLVPGSPEWRAAWFADPHRITRCLTFTELYDPALNPLHSMALWPGPPPDRPAEFPIFH